jgi:hypothetical protein
MSEMVKASGLFHHNLVMAAGRNSSLCDKFRQCPVDGERFGGALAMFSCWQAPSLFTTQRYLIAIEMLNDATLQGSSREYQVTRKG